MSTGSTGGAAGGGHEFDGRGTRPDIHVTDALAEDQVQAVLALVERATQADGVAPLSEHVMLDLRHGGETGARNLLLRRDGRVAGYAHLDPADQGQEDPAARPSGELVIDPEFRRRGLGLELARALESAAGPGGLQVWAHGELPAADRLAATAGWQRSRSLWQLRRSLAAALPEPRVADGFAVRPFQVGRDEDAWTDLNHRAFAHHPEQGGWTRADLELREQEPWFDPDGFFVAERDGQLAGFHWTKIHGPSAGGGAVGEVYVVGVDESARGTGLGRALTLIGLHYLRDRGLPDVMLYVDESNTAAVRLYESLGFTRWHTDVMFSTPGEAPTPH